MKAAELPLWEYLIGLGSNQNAMQCLAQAFREFQAAGFTRLQLSTPAWSRATGDGKAPDYLNAAAQIECHWPAFEMQRWLKQLELRSGRTLAMKAAGLVSLDLDLLARRCNEHWKVYPRRATELGRSYLQPHLTELRILHSDIQPAAAIHP